MKRKFRWQVLYGAALTLFTAYVLLDAFVIPRSYAVVSDSTSNTVQTTVQSGSADTSADTAGNTTVAAEVTDDSYQSDGISVKITQYREDDTDIYVADVVLSDGETLKTALADNTYGKNITATTSSMAETNNAILAVNGDFYGTQNSGYVIRNGVLYRDTSAGNDRQDLVIDGNGNLSIVNEYAVTAQELLDDGAQQVLSFGPGLVENGDIVVDPDTEVYKAMVSNPRTAIGQIGENHYVFVVADGRTDASAGLSLYQLAQFMESKLGVETAYNLDGGGSSTMVFNGTIINHPTTGGSRTSEREVSDIVYIG